jgi:hypothetical protein
MSNNVPITAGAGTDVATDQVAGTLEQVQLFKLTYSAAGVRTLVPVDADGLLVNLGANNDVAVSSLPAGLATLAEQQTQTTALQLIDNAVSGAGFNVTQLAGVAPSLNTGVRDAGTQRVTIATNDVVPVSGTVTTSPPANASTNVAQLAGTATSVNSGTKDAGTLRVVIATDQPALTNKLLVTPDSVALPANQSVNAAQLAGTTTDTNSGNKSAGTLRVVLATDQPALTNKLLVTPDSVALPANQSVNINQIAGVTPVLNTGTRAAGVLRVTVATDDLVPVSGTVTVTPPTLTKATQGATGFSVQNLKDAGRVSIMITASVASTATTETLITLTRSIGLAATGTGSSLSITSGKRFRIQALSASARNSTGTTAGNVTLNFRAAVGGATTASSPLQMHWVVALPASAVSTLFNPIMIADGFEIDSNAGTNTFGMTITHAAWVTGSVVATFDITMVGYEY